MDTALPQKFPFILDRNLAKANCTGNRVCTSCDTVVLGCNPSHSTWVKSYLVHHRTVVQEARQSEDPSDVPKFPVAEVEGKCCALAESSWDRNVTAMSW